MWQKSFGEQEEVSLMKIVGERWQFSAREGIFALLFYGKFKPEMHLKLPVFLQTLAESNVNTRLQT